MVNFHQMAAFIMVGGIYSNVDAIVDGEHYFEHARVFVDVFQGTAVQASLRRSAALIAAFCSYDLTNIKRYSIPTRYAVVPPQIIRLDSHHHTSDTDAITCALVCVPMRPRLPRYTLNA